MTVQVEERGAALWVRLDRPERRNALNRAMIDGLLDALERAGRSGVCRCLVLAGTQGNFSAGRDLGAVSPRQTLPGYLEQDGAWTEVFNRLTLLAKPSVAVVEGYAVAGGFTLAMACDFVVATRAARFGALEMRNAFPAAINTPLLAKLVGPRVGLELLMTGDLFTAQRLYEVGLVNRLAEDAAELARVAGELVERLARLDPDAVAMTKTLHRAALSAPLQSALDMGTYANALLAASGRIAEAEARFAEKKEQSR